MTQSEKARGATTTEWDICALSDISEKIMVGIASAATHAYRSKGVPLLRNQNIGAGWLDDSDVLFVDPEYERVFRNKRLRAGDLLTARTGYPGLTCVVPDAYENAQSFTTLITRPDPQAVDSNYLVAYINSSRGQQFFNQSQIGGAQKNVNAATLRGMPIPLPQLNEQQAIAGALSDVDALLGGLDQLITKKRDLKQAAMQQLLTGQSRLPGFESEWAEVRLRDLGTVYGGLTGKTKADFGSGTDQYVTFVNVMNNVTIDNGLFEQVRVGPMESQNLVKSGDLLFNGSSETPEEVAMCSLVSGEIQGRLFLNSFCFGFRLHSGAETDALFLAYYLRSREGRELMKSLAQGSTRYNLSKGALLYSVLHLPSKAEQAAIAFVLGGMDAELLALEARLRKTRSLKEAMMQELLTGRIRLI